MKIKNNPDAIPFLLLGIYIVAVTLFSSMQCGRAPAATKNSDDIVVGVPPKVESKAQDAGPSDPRAALTAFLARINKSFREAGSTSDIRFTIYYSTQQPNMGAIVINDVPNPDGGQGIVFAKFFYRDENGQWTMIPDTFELP